MDTISFEVGCGLIPVFGEECRDVDENDVIADVCAGYGLADFAIPVGPELSVERDTIRDCEESDMACELFDSGLKEEFDAIEC